MHPLMLWQQLCCTCTKCSALCVPAPEDAAHGRGPPLAAALHGRNPLGVEVAGDLSEGSSEPMFPLDAGRDFLRSRRGPAAIPRLSPRAPRGLGVFGEVA